MRLLIGWLWVFSAAVQADPLAHALQIVEGHSPEVAEQRAQWAIERDRRDWVSKVNMAYQTQATDQQGQGLSAGWRFEIPLFGPQKRLQVNKARHQVRQATQKVRQSFLSDLSQQAEQVQKLTVARELWALKQDKLDYFKALEQQGVIEPQKLWTHAEASVSAEHEVRAIEAAQAVQLDTLARSYGGDEWKRLRALLAEYLNSTTR